MLETCEGFRCIDCGHEVEDMSGEAIPMNPSALAALFLLTISVALYAIWRGIR